MAVTPLSKRLCSLLLPPAARRPPIALNQVRGSARARAAAGARKLAWKTHLFEVSFFCLSRACLGKRRLRNKTGGVVPPLLPPPRAVVARVSLLEPASTRKTHAKQSIAVPVRSNLKNENRTDRSLNLSRSETENGSRSGCTFVTYRASFSSCHVSVARPVAAAVAPAAPAVLSSFSISCAQRCSNHIHSGTHIK